MDDTLWVADSKIQINAIVKIAQSFYNMANIKVNPSKSILATNTSSKTLPDLFIVFNGQTIKAITQSTPFHFLGYWYTINNKQMPVQKIIVNKISDALLLLKKAIITEKQAIYIINTVILTRLEYRSQNYILNENKYKNLIN